MPRNRKRRSTSSSGANGHDEEKHASNGLDDTDPMSLSSGEKEPHVRLDACGAPEPDFSTLPFIMRYRWIFVLIFLFPLSFVFEIAMWLKLKCRSVTPEQHQRRVSRLQANIRVARASGQSRICTDRPAWMAMALRPNLYKNEMQRVKMRDFNNILNVDTQNRVVRVEPFVTVGELTAKLIPLGYTLPVLPELDDLSVGGLLMGVGIESSSHKHGLFNESCLAYEVVLANGDLVRATADNEHAELFQALPWSYGTLGMLVAAELKIIPAKKYVRLVYKPCHTHEAVVRTFTNAACAKQPSLFVEGLAYSQFKAVVMVGDLATEEDRRKEGGKVNNVGRWYKPWFYQHVRKILLTSDKRTEEYVEYIPLRQYYHRHTRSIFWEMREIVSFGNEPWFRWLLGWMLPIKVSLLKLTTPSALQSTYEEKFVFQDMLVPVARLSDCLNFFHQEFALYPLWLCPHKLYKRQHQGLLSPADNTLQKDEYEMYVDVGAYGMPTVRPFSASKSLPVVESFVTKVHGYQMLYADTYMTRDEFHRMFDHTLYDQMRKRYGAASVFPSVYDKVRKR